LTVFTESPLSASESLQASKSSFLISSIFGSGYSFASSISGDFQFFTASLSIGGRNRVGERGLVFALETLFVKREESSLSVAIQGDFVSEKSSVSSCLLASSFSKELQSIQQIKRQI
jgi:hypothetical protein